MITALIAVSLVGFLLLATELVTGGRLGLFGPVLVYDVIRTARRGRYFLLRGLYALVLLLLLLYVWSFWREFANVSSGSAQPDLALLGEAFFYTIMVVQFFAVCAITPGYVAGSIAEEKERKTIEYLLASDLANREIVFGKLISRIGNIIMLLMAGLPIVSLAQLFGGVDPQLLLVSFAATAVTMLGLSGIAIVQSVQRRRARDAIIMTYVLAIAYVATSRFLAGIVSLHGLVPDHWSGQVLRAIQPVADVYAWGDPIAVVYSSMTMLLTNAALGDLLWETLLRYAAFHLTVFLASLAYAILTVRSTALGHAPVVPKKSRAGRRRSRPGVFESRPVLWKEFWIERFRMGVLARLGVVVFIALCFTPLAVAVFAIFYEEPGNSSRQWEDFREFTNGWVRTLTTILGSLMVLFVGVRASTSVGSERDRDTMTNLLTTPLTAGEILGDKYWGAILSGRGLAYCLSVVWLIGIVTGSVHPIAAFVLVPVMLVPVAAAASIGVVFSAYSPTTLRSLLQTLSSMALLLGGHWTCGGICCYAPLAFAHVGSGIEYIVAFQAGATPPVLFAVIPISWRDIESLDLDRHVFIAFCGSLVWLIVAIVGWSIALDRFASNTNRGEVYRPDRPAEAVV